MSGNVSNSNYHNTMHHLHEPSRPYFWAACDIDNLWFYGLSVHTLTGMTFLCMGVGLLAVFMVIVEAVREKIRINVEQHFDIFQTRKRSPDDLDMRQSERRRQILFHIIQTILHSIHYWIGSMIMLAIMTFNLWIGISAVIGLVLGYFLFLLPPSPSYKHRCATKTSMEDAPDESSVADNDSPLESNGVSPSTSSNNPLVVNINQKDGVTEVDITVANAVFELNGASPIVNDNKQQQTPLEELTSQQGQNGKLHVKIICKD